MVEGQGQRSIFWRAAADIRGSALPNAVKSNKNHYKSNVFVCVSIISQRTWIISFYIYSPFFLLPMSMT